jgi:hypothetical protein
LRNDVITEFSGSISYARSLGKVGCLWFRYFAKSEGSTRLGGGGLGVDWCEHTKLGSTLHRRQKCVTSSSSTYIFTELDATNAESCAFGGSLRDTT